MSTFYDFLAVCQNGTIWAMDPGYFAGMLAQLGDASAASPPEALMAKAGVRHQGARAVAVRDGVAVIRVAGPITRYDGFLTWLFGGTAVSSMALDLQVALDDPAIRGVVLEMNSPGGEVAGINELAKQIRAGSRRKKIVAYGEGQVASGAYWLASAASEIVVDETAMLGSIGVVMSYMDTRQRDENSGVRRVEIVSSQSPDKRVTPTDDAGIAKWQSMADELGGIFVSAVAKFRGKSEQHVVNNFGRGGVLIGKQAVKVGMADRISTLERVIAEMQPSKAAAQSATNAHSGVATSVSAERPARSGHGVGARGGIRGFSSGGARAMPEAQTTAQAQAEKAMAKAIESSTITCGPHKGKPLFRARKAATYPAAWDDAVQKLGGT